jgi:SAM-dependent methyltransferase
MMDTVSQNWRIEERRLRLRVTFEEVPELYDRARPTYPPGLFADLEMLARLGPGSRVLEIGCGTGKATFALAERGYRITAVELGPSLAAVARRNLRQFPEVEVVNADFDRWTPDGGIRFDAVVAFSAFHWLDPATAYSRCREMLKPTGVLAMSGARHVVPRDGDPLFQTIQEDYKAFASDWDEGRPPPPPDDVPDWAGEIRAGGHFDHVDVRRYVWDVVYGPQEYIDVIDTYSGHRVMPLDTRRPLYKAIYRRIEAQGTVRKTYLAILHVAHRAA